MGSFHKIHVVCLLSFILKAWHAECDTQQLSCSVEQLGANAQWNPQVPDKGKEPQVCVSHTKKTCCTRQTEASLRIKAAKNIKTQLQTKYMAAKKAMLSLFDDLKGHFHSLMEESNRQSITFLLGKQPNLTADEVIAVSKLFKDLENYLAEDKQELEDIVNAFFRSSFPMLLRYFNPEGKTLSAKYKSCLKDNMDIIKPFGTRPAELLGKFEEVFEPVGSLFKGLKFGVEVLSLAQQFNFTDGCKNGLLEMKFCSLCQGLTQVKPCYEFCMDTTRKCLLSEAQLQRKWGQLIDTVLSLAKSVRNSNLENFLNSLHTDLWHAATFMLLQKANFMPQVLKECGKPSYSDAKTSPYKESVSPTPHVKERLFAKMDAVHRQLNALNSFFQDLAREFCVVDGLASQKENIDNCWNGTFVARYEPKQGDSSLSLESKNHLTFLERKIHGQIKMMEKYTITRDDDDDDELDESGSASGSGDKNRNKISESGCGEDDEDCGSTSSGENNNIVDFERENDFDFITTPSSIKSSGNEVLGGGFDPTSTRKSGDVLAQGNSSSSLAVTWLQFFTLLLLVWLTRG